MTNEIYFQVRFYGPVLSKENFFANWDEKKFSCDTGQVKSYLFLVRFKNGMWLGLMFVYHTIVDNNMV